MIDNVLRIATPEGVEFELHPAGPMVRLCAFLIDGLIQIVGYSIVSGILLISGLTGTWIYALLGFAVMWFYFVVSELAGSGRSVGKRVLGLRVVMRDGSPITPGASIIRNLLRFVDSIALLGLICPLIAPGFRRLGDIAAGTLVIYQPERFSVVSYDGIFEGRAPRPAERILDAESSAAIVEFGRRSTSLSPGRVRELAHLALPLYVLETQPTRPRQDSLGSGTIEMPEKRTAISTAPERILLSMGAWYAGLRDEQRL